MSNATMPCAGRPAMRHDPATGAIVVMLRGLKMPGMAQAVTDLMQQWSPAFEAAVPILPQLLKAETAEREVRSVRSAESWVGKECVSTCRFRWQPEHYKPHDNRQMQHNKNEA